MPDLLLNAMIVYVLGLFIVPDLRAGSLARRILEVPYYPLVRLGLWHRWSMYAPDVPTGTPIAITGVVHEDGTFEVIPLPGFDDDDGFGKARNLRFIAFQWALCSDVTDYMKRSLCRYAFERWRHESDSSTSDRPWPVAVEIRE